MLRNQWPNATGMGGRMSMESPAKCDWNMQIEREWQEIHTILSYFGRRRSESITKYKEFIKQGLSDIAGPESIGGGLLRSLGGWSEVIALRHKGKKPSGDERILGRSEFVDKVIGEFKLQVHH
jgi:putative transposase